MIDPSPSLRAAPIVVSGEGCGHFFRPPLPQGYIKRPRLCERLLHGLGGRLLFIGAPAGFGKSSLAIEFCEGLPAGWQSLWLGLASRDSDPGRFLERLLAGLQSCYPGLASEAAGVLKLRQRHQPFAFEAWLGELLDELGERLDTARPLLVVLDDYHLAQGAVLDGCLQFLLNHLPAGLILLVTSRQRPDWHLARLRLSRQLLELQEQDLRLDEREVETLLRERGVRLTAAELAELRLRSEGWVAGLRLWLLAAEEGGAVRGQAGLQGAQGLIRDYLLEEVIGRQPQAVQAFLYETAGQERICAELCDALRDARDSSEILRHLQAHQVFLVPLDSQGRWFRYHHLFSDLLRARSEPALANGRHLRASNWFAAQGSIGEAVEHALRAGQPGVAAQLVQNLSEEQLLGEQDFAALLRWKANLPDSLLVSTPRLIALYGWALVLACQLDAAEDLIGQLQRFLPAPDAEQQRNLIAQWLALSGVIARGRGDSDRARRHCEAALQDLPLERYGQRLLCLSTLGNLAISQNDIWQARAINRNALELAQRVGNPLFEALVHHDRARSLQARGEVSRALGEVEIGLARLRGLPGDAYATRARLRLYGGYLLTVRLQPQDAREQLRAGISEARACRDLGVLLGHCCLAALDGREGRFAEAFAELAEAERLMHMWDVPAVYYLAIITLSKCELWLLQGQTELAAVWLQRLAETYGGEQAAAAPEFQPQLHLHIALLQGVLATTQGRAEAAERFFSGLTKTGIDSLPGTTARVQMILLLRRAGREHEARMQLRGCVQALAGGALLPFRQLLEQEPQWLGERLREYPNCPLCLSLLEQLPAAVVLPTACCEGLSTRELAVLQLIAQGCSNQQISERLFISLHTVKTHARHINGKLNVQRRTEAVARAQVLGLLNS
ncbi:MULTISPECIES: LuxR C-terminal-related transcriptional regulator [Pseudomonas]|uniref:LuxR C-terminal-related transcriptional regulator n=1 Tax=Pseudomonas TaxID=286 RepID=UPI00069682B1|nr:MULTISPECIES: LuxR C-terminal-related transcriptional regulator [Pseudomonas]